MRCNFAPGGRAVQSKLFRKSVGSLSLQRNPLNWLILGGVLLIASIVIGTAFTIVSFRQRALENSERELENTVLLLVRHFDRELNNFEMVQKALVGRIQSTGVASPDAFARQMSGIDVHLALQADLSGESDVAGINVFDANGQLINSSRSWPAPAISIADRSYFKTSRPIPGRRRFCLQPSRAASPEDGRLSLLAKSPDRMVSC